eukprot:CAMPEP_0184699422 /NCGR_PEP_ID=MMETSP0313-20130426/5703_1 /TAXON_ID=2792 /ORGANISM="Porphyridium aerugineum, Strain SAG 1380-2" /LENGTH=423 /DNA_ID=CAMNT_0027158515 /DNA_START=358 /DNA_END=1629 /DNA_ORIENTATION=+
MMRYELPPLSQSVDQLPALQRDSTMYSVPQVGSFSQLPSLWQQQQQQQQYQPQSQYQHQPQQQQYQPQSQPQHQQQAIPPLFAYPSSGPIFPPLQGFRASPQHQQQGSHGQPYYGQQPPYSLSSHQSWPGATNPPAIIHPSESYPNFAKELSSETNPSVSVPNSSSMQPQHSGENRYRKIGITSLLNCDERVLAPLPSMTAHGYAHMTMATTNNAPQRQPLSDPIPSNYRPIIEPVLPPSNPTNNMMMPLTFVEASVEEIHRHRKPSTTVTVHEVGPVQEDQPRAHTHRSSQSGSHTSSESDQTPERRTLRSSRKRWTPEEDQLVRDAVAEFGAKNWDKIASCVPGRNAQHVRLRYHNYIRFTKEEKARSFSKEEDALILEMARKDVRQWSKLAEQMGRPHSAVKNRYYFLSRVRQASSSATP